MILKENRNTLLFIAILLLAFSLRIISLGQESIWLDEGISIAMSKLDFFAMLDKSVLDTSPPLYYLLLHYWMLFFGDSEFAVRFLSLIFGMMSIALTYQLVKILFHQNLALLTAFLLAISVFHVEYSQEARAYSLITLLSVASWFVFLKWKQSDSKLMFTLLLLVNVLFLYTHVLALFFIMAQNLFFLLSKDKGYIRVKSWMVLQMALVLCFLPWLGMLYTQTSAWQSTSWMPLPSLKDIAGTIVTYSGSVLLALVYIVLATKALLSYKKETSKFTFLVSCFALPTMILLVFCFLFHSIYLQKYTIASSIPFFILVSYGIQSFEQRKHRIALLFSIIILAAIKLAVYYFEDSKEQWRDAVSLVESKAAKDDVVLFDAAYCKHNAFDYYAKRSDLKKLPLVDVREEVNEQNVLRLDSLSNEAKSTWLVLSHSRDSKGLVKKKIKNDYEVLIHQEFIGIEIYRLRRAR